MMLYKMGVLEQDREFILFNKRHIKKHEDIMNKDIKDMSDVILRKESEVLKNYYERLLEKLRIERQYTKKEIDEVDE